MASLTVHLPGKLLAVSLNGPDEPTVAPSPAVIAQHVQQQVENQTRQKHDELRQAMLALEMAGAELAALRLQLLKEAEHQMVDLAIDIARKVLMQEIQAGRYEIDPIVKEALAAVPTRQDVVVRLNPDDLARCQMARDAQDGSEGSIRFVADPSVAPAQAIVESAGGVIDSSMERNLLGVAEGLKNLE